MSRIAQTAIKIKGVWLASTLGLTASERASSRGMQDQRHASSRFPVGGPSRPANPSNPLPLVTDRRAPLSRFASVSRKCLSKCNFFFPSSTQQRIYTGWNGLKSPHSRLAHFAELPRRGRFLRASHERDETRRCREIFVALRERVRMQVQGCCGRGGVAPRDILLPRVRTKRSR
jgi:hypothetical protein